MPATPAASSSPPEPTRPSAVDSEVAADFRGSRRLVGAEEWFWYLAAAVSYILLGIWHKWLLNWFVGPGWLVAFVVIGPWLTDRLGVTGRAPAGDVSENGLRGRGTQTGT
ncbi:MAG: hypothetical protein WA964_06760 [Ilumatobacter sp.]|uniref:hypothetical protein n=1 Tax=Ilumatobacter sp. TaxID=1967498 RepID=UPI003C7524F4